MENFKEFELEMPEMILGGELLITYYVDADGNAHRDFYDTDRDIIIYIPADKQ